MLDGIRALSVIIVLLFHFWQQTWIFPRISTPFLSWMGINSINFSNFARVGYLFVDAMILLSGFLLFLPVARQIFMGEELPSWKQFIKKRIARILPSYISCILILFIIELARGGYPNAGAAALDLITHLTFTQTLFPSSYLYTHLNGVLWTVAIEVWFYVLFPFIAMFIKRRTEKENSVQAALTRVLTVYIVMNLISWLYINKFVLKNTDNLPMTINQLPAFFGVYANGMAAAMIYTAISKNFKRSLPFDLTNTALCIISLLGIIKLVNSCVSLGKLPLQQAWQVEQRFVLSLAFTGFILSSALSVKPLRWLLGNRFMKFLSGISFNLYIWHQWLAVQFKNTWRIPAWSGNTPPNMLNDRVWMWKYAAVITVAAFAAAIVATYLIEKPCSNLILGKPGFKLKARTKTKAKTNKKVS